MNQNDKKLDELENKLQYRFKNKELLKMALTHPSEEKTYNYERLEFLGDAVLELAISEWLYRDYPNYSEGKLTKLRSSIVCSKSLVEIAVKLDLGKYLFLGKGEELTGGRNKPSILENVVEAVIGAVYLDDGFDETKNLIRLLFNKTVFEKNSQPASDFKSRLQEIIHKTSKLPIKYEIVEKNGPPHKTVFIVELSVGDNVISQGSGLSKKSAEQNAAQKAIDIFDKKNN